MRLVVLGTVMGAALSGCGGGGGTASTPAPPVASTTPIMSDPAPTPSATPAALPVTAPTTPTIVTGGVNDTVEYRNSAGAQQANAVVAYNAGFTGAGVTAAIIDTGIDTSSAEFAGRISSASVSTAGNSTIKDEGGHGTAVAGVLAAAKNDTGIQGIAYGTNLLVVRSDTPGSCAQTGGCKHDDNAIARGIDVAIGGGARVINISLGGEVPNAALQSALSRATGAGVVVVISAGNDSAANPDDLALIANNAAVAKGLIVIAGANDANGAIASFSNLAGTGASHYLTALGVRVRSSDENGAQFLYSGTSFSAPLVAGAVALLAQAFPNLTGAQIVNLLFASADDVGSAGTDATYGNGRLNLVEAFAPRGATSLAGSAVPVSLTDNGVTSPPMGDAGGQAGQAAGVILDGYGRAYALNLGRTLRAPAPSPRLAPALAGGTHSIAMRAGETVMAVTIAPRAGTGVEISRLSLARDDAAIAHATAGMVATRVGRTGIAFGFGQSAAVLDDSLAGRRSLPFLIAGDAADAGFNARQGTALAIAHQLGRLSLGASAEQGDARVGLAGAGAIGHRDERSFGYSRVALTAERRAGPLALGIAASRLTERATVLGARLGYVFGSGGATSDFIDARARIDGPAGWQLAGTMRRGSTRTGAGGAALSGGAFASESYALDLSRENLFARGDRFALRVAQPLRISHGGYALTLPTGYDYATGVTATTLTTIDLAPRGRELDVEGTWGLAVGPGWMTTNVYWRREPGNMAALPDDLGVALRYGFSF